MQWPRNSVTGQANFANRPAQPGQHRREVSDRHRHLQNHALDLAPPPRTKDHARLRTPPPTDHAHTGSQLPAAPRLAATPLPTPIIVIFRPIIAHVFSPRMTQRFSPKMAQGFSPKMAQGLSPKMAHCFSPKMAQRTALVKLLHLRHTFLQKGEEDAGKKTCGRKSSRTLTSE